MVLENENGVKVNCPLVDKLDRNLPLYDACKRAFPHKKIDNRDPFWIWFEDNKSVVQPCGCKGFTQYGNIHAIKGILQVDLHQADAIIKMWKK